MSRRAAVAVSECIDGVGCGSGANVRRETVAADDINRALEQSCGIILERDVFIDANPGCRIDFNHDVYIAVGPVVATRPRAEQRGVTDITRAQRCFVFPKLGKESLTVHSSMTAGKIVLSASHFGPSRASLQDWLTPGTLFCEFWACVHPAVLAVGAAGSPLAGPS